MAKSKPVFPRKKRLESNVHLHKVLSEYRMPGHEIISDKFATKEDLEKVAARVAALAKDIIVIQEWIEHHEYSLEGACEKNRLIIKEIIGACYQRKDHLLDSHKSIFPEDYEKIVKVTGWEKLSDFLECIVLSKSSRQTLAELTGIPVQRLIDYVNIIDLYRINGVFIEKALDLVQNEFTSIHALATIDKRQIEIISEGRNKNRPKISSQSLHDWKGQALQLKLKGFHFDVECFAEPPEVFQKWQKK